MYASGRKRSYCRKISKRRETLVRNHAARKISKTARDMLRRKQKRDAAISPMSKHYKQLAESPRNQPSIYKYRKRCKLFPHPVELFSPDGIRVPVGYNFALEMKRVEHALRVPILLPHFVPKLKPHQHIYNFRDADEKPTWPGDISQKFPRTLYETGSVIVGIKFVADLDTGEGGHMVFFEVRTDTDEGPRAMVVDPNGQVADDHHKCLEHFFDGIPYEVVTTFYVNRGEGSGALRWQLQQLGLVDESQLEQGEVWIAGYCATIAMFFLIDYVCTEQWEAKDAHHFVRSSREWLMAPEENDTQLFSPEAITIRVVLFARYLAYEILNVFHPELAKELVSKHNVTFHKTKFVTYLDTPSPEEDPTTQPILMSKITVGTKKYTIWDDGVLPMESFQSTFMDEVSKRLF